MHQRRHAQPCSFFDTGDLRLQELAQLEAQHLLHEEPIGGDISTHQVSVINPLNSGTTGGNIWG